METTLDQPTNPNNPPCVICGQPSNGYHFGVQACRACASFFRRSMAEQKTYVCRRENNCNVSGDGMRNCCRSCRLRRCHEAGMQRDDVPSSTTNDSLPNIVTSSTQYPKLSAPLSLSPKSLEYYPTLSRLVRGYECFINAQRSLFSVEYPNTVFNRGHFIETNKAEHLKLEKASMPLLYTMFNEYYDPMRYIAREEKIRLIENYWQQIGMLHRGYLTVQAFPDLEDTRIVLASGLYMDTNNMRAFMGEVTSSPEKMDEYIKMRMPILQAMSRFIRKYKEQQIRIIDTAALICTALWADAEKMDIESDQIQEHKERVLSEWTSNLTATYGPDQAGIRMARMLCLLVDLNHISNILQEATLITRIFWPKDMDHLLNELTCDRDAYVEILRNADESTTY
ncbi:Nuclear hormone receptor family member nhr-86 [Aphelenchoides bicaudatus]|nr:Nuclear hormone receptor family member nhr-86 [Aphelenchoides bicaudatus]